MYANKYGVCQNVNYPLTSSSKGKTVNILPLWTTNKLHTWELKKKWVLSWVTHFWWVFLVSKYDKLLINICILKGTCSFSNGAGKGTLYKVKTFYFAKKSINKYFKF
jgi:hypothetical protein